MLAAMASDAQRPDPLAWLDDADSQHEAGDEVFAEQLEGCRIRLIELAGDVSQRILPVTDAFLDGDADAARDHIVHRRIAADCERLEDACFYLLARQGPAGADLRRIVATIRCVTPIERGASIVAHVARSLTWVHPPSMPQRLRETLRELAGHAAQVFEGAVGAWRDLDGHAAAELQRSDDEVDLLQKLLLTELYTGAQSTEESVSLALIARYLERLGDHGVEMARQVAYAVTGRRSTDAD